MTSFYLRATYLQVATYKKAKSLMVIIGLTGSIGMGKSTVARQFAAFGAKVCSADACVHKLMAKGGVAVGEIAKYFTDAVRNHEIDRQGVS